MKIESATWEWFDLIRSTDRQKAQQRTEARSTDSAECCLLMCQQMVGVGGNWVIIEKNVKRWSDTGTAFGVGSDFNLTHFIAGDCVSECAPLRRASAGNCHCLSAATGRGGDVNQQYNKVEQSATKALARVWSICLFICCHFRFSLFPIVSGSGLFLSSSRYCLYLFCPILLKSSELVSYAFSVHWNVSHCNGISYHSSLGDDHESLHLSGSV